MRYSAEKKLFQERTVTEIRKGKTKVTEIGFMPSYPLNANVARTVDGLREDEYLEIDAIYRLVPLEYDNARQFLKKGRHLNIPVPATREDCMREQKGLMTRIKERMEGAKDGYRGYGWTGMGSAKHKIFGLTDNLEGLELYAAADPNKGLAGGIIGVKDYGQRCIVMVPSRSEEKTHKVDLLSIPLDDSWNIYADALNLEARCDCEDASFHGSLNYKYRYGEERFCPHAVAAYFAVAREKLQDRAPRIKQNPMPVPKEGTARFARKLDENVLIHRLPETKRAQLLSKTEKEVLLWGYLQMKGPEDSFWFDEAALVANRAVHFALN